MNKFAIGTGAGVLAIGVVAGGMQLFTPDGPAHVSASTMQTAISKSMHIKGDDKINCPAKMVKEKGNIERCEVQQGKKTTPVFVTYSGVVKGKDTYNVSVGQLPSEPRATSTKL